MKTLIERLLPLQDMIMQSGVHDSMFGKWVVTSLYFDKLVRFCAEVDCEFMYLDVLRSSERNASPFSRDYPLVPAKQEFQDAIRIMDTNTCHIEAFLSLHKNIEITLSKSIEFLETMNEDFKNYLANKEAEKPFQNGESSESVFLELIQEIESLDYDEKAKKSIADLNLEKRLREFKGELSCILENESLGLDIGYAKKDFYWRYTRFKYIRLSALREEARKNYSSKL